MKIDDKKLEEILTKENYITSEDIETAKEAIAKNKVSLFEYLLSERIITKNLIGQAIAESLHVPFSDLSSIMPTPEQVQKIPEEIAKKYHAVVFSEEKDVIVIATDDPANKKLSQELKTLFTGKKINISYALSDDISLCFIHYQKPLETRFSKIIKSNERVAPEILEEIFKDALIFHASDIHFEPRLNDIIIRFRVDGVLQEAGKIPKKYYENILNRIKVKSGLRIDEHFSAQDGSLQYINDSTITDLRTSIVPTVEGEKGRNGFDFISEIKSKEAVEKAHVVIFTELGQDDDKEKAKKLGVDYFFVKTKISINDLIEQLKQIVQ